MEKMTNLLLQNKRVTYTTLGCKVNAYETDCMRESMEEAGAVTVSEDEPADICIINSCTVTNIADRKSRQMLHRMHKQNPNAIVVAAGCYAQAAGEELLKDRAVTLVLGNEQKQHIVTILEQYLAEHDVYHHSDKLCTVSDLSHAVYEHASVSGAGENTRAYVKIQDGCNQFCSYCIIPYARGRIRSRKEEDVLSEIRRLHHNGYKEIVLTGIHLSSYGFDDATAQEKANLLMTDGSIPILKLLDRITSSVERPEQIRLGSLEPRIITDEFVQNIAGMPGLCPHFHLSLQSGCDKTLAAMNRKYTTAQYAESCTRLRRCFQLPAITTDIIVGFPGETEEDFVTCEQFVTQIGFAGIHIFPYSRRKGTVADKMPMQLTEAVKKQRVARLGVLEQRLQRSYREDLIRLLQEDTVLFEQEEIINGIPYITGYSSRYCRVSVPAGEAGVNTFTSVKLCSVTDTEHILGTVK